MEETLQPQPDTGMGGKTIRYQEAWKLVKGVEFIQKGFFFLFKSEDSEKRLQDKLRICPFSGSREEETAYTEKLEEELRENIIEQIHPEQAKWFNPTFIIPKPHQKWRKILDASSLNKEGQMIHFKMNGTDQDRDLIWKGEQATSLDRNSAFHHLVIYPPHKPYLAFEAIGKVYQYRAMPGSNEDTKRVGLKNFDLHGRSAPPTLEQRKIAKINLDNNENFRSIWMDNSLGEKRNRTKTIDQLPSVDLRLGKDVYKDGRPKKTGTTLLIKEIYQSNRKTSPNQNQISSINNRQTKFLRVYVREASLYLRLIDSAKTRALKNKEWKENMVLPKEILLELYLRQGVIMRNQAMTLEVRVPEAVMVSYASPKGWGVTLELQTGYTLVQHGEWNMEQKRWTSSKKEMEAIYLGLFCYGSIFKELQIKAILIKSDSSTVAQDLAKQRADSTYTRNLKQDNRCISRLSTKGDYQIKKEIFIALCQVWEIIPILDLFATGENKLMDRFVAIGEEEEEVEWLNAVLRPWKEEIFRINPPIPKIGKALIAWEKFKPKSIMIVPWWPGQIWITHLLAGSSRYLILVESSLILNQGKETTKREDMLLSGKIAAFLMYQDSNKGENYQQSFSITQA
ncbi:MAG: hypothetical protein EZS28_030199 [Streblomastix strix]|uniref:Uncharacterized protein n=1 Tax=Streblomastix strix TaxID=222440 RepID=A0A5J4UVB6_9EUKA|nr:MAG: hypothetical protein EZS28_030199 [Streblomastix strix]